MIFTVINMKGKSCFICGESDERVLEKHHIYSKKYGERPVWLCLNHHRIVTDNQNQIPTKIRKSRSQRNIDIYAINSMGSLLSDMGNELVRISKRLSEGGK